MLTVIVGKAPIGMTSSVSKRRDSKFPASCYNLLTRFETPNGTTGRHYDKRNVSRNLTNCGRCRVWSWLASALMDAVNEAERNDAVRHAPAEVADGSGCPALM